MTSFGKKAIGGYNAGWWRRATMQTMTINLPDDIDSPLKRTAKAARKPVNKILPQALAEGLPPLETSLPEYEQELSVLETLSDDELWKQTQATAATVLALQLNHLIAAQARENWVQAGWWPPED
jgi:hypothetical protein